MSGTMRYVAAAQVLDRRDHPDVDRAFVQERRALRRRIEPQREQVAAQLQAVDQRPRVQIIDGAETNGSSSARRVTAGSLEPAVPLDRARARPRGCCRGSLRAGCAASQDARIDRRHAVDVVGADGQRDLRELRAIERPVDLDGVDVRQRAAAPAPPASRRRSRWSASRPTADRGSGANARKPPTADCTSRARVSERRRAIAGAGRRRSAAAPAGRASRAARDRRRRDRQAIDRRFGDRLETGLAQAAPSAVVRERHRAR